MTACRLCLLIVALLICGAGLARAEVAYKTDIAGVEDSGLRSRLRNAAQLVKLEDRPPPTVAALRRRAEGDLPTLLQILHDQGYWGASIDVAIDSEAKPAAVTLKVTQGPLYHIAKVALVAPDGGAPPAAPGLDPASLGLPIGGPAIASSVIGANTKIVTSYSENGRPFAKIADRRVVVDDGTHTMSITYTVDAGPATTFGAAQIEGLTDLDASYVRRRIAWQQGASYDQRELAETRKALVDSNLFSVVDITRADTPAPDGSVPMTIRLFERAPHSVGAGVEYSTSLGIGTRLFWEDRNIFGHAESLRITGNFAQSVLGASAQFRRPDFFHKDQDFLLGADLADEMFPAYTSRRLRLQTGIERRFPRQMLTAGASFAYERGNLDAVSGPRHYSLLGLPLYLRYDSTGSLLNPEHGARAGIETTPYYSIKTGVPSFVSSRVSGSIYIPLIGEDRLVSASYVRVGSILGASRDQLPADKRFYVGGGGSIRGYSYQRVGPLLDNDKPLGGQSSLEMGTEMRTKITDTIGIVPFIEAGNVYNQPFPKLGGRLFVGAGIGLRYYTPIGPVRLDLATPVTPIRPGDGRVQVYISLGQAF